MTFVDRHAVYMLEKVVQHNEKYSDDNADGDRRQGYPVESQYNKRRQKQRGPSSAMSWTAEYRRINQTSEYIDAQATRLAAAVKTKEGELKPLLKAVGDLQETLTGLRRAVRTDASKLGNLMKTKKTLQDKRRSLLPQEEKLRELRQRSYYWNKLANAAQSTSTSSSSTARQSGGDSSAQTTVATWAQPTVEDSTRRLDISDLVNHDTDNPQRHIVFAGTDYGITTMSETVALTRQEIDTYISRHKPAAQ
ncbi:hypothetical protein BGZ73_001242, partial [Actinomortierella ambigua]